MAKLTEADPKEVKTLEKRVTKATDIANKVAVKNEKTEAQAAEVLSKLNKAKDEIIERKEQITKPLNAALKSARELFKPLEVDLDGAIHVVKESMSKYHTEVEEKRKKKLAQIAAREEKGTIKTETALRKVGEVGDVKKKVNTDQGEVQYAKVKEYVVEDEKKLPRKYLVPDMGAIKADLKAGKKVPGAKIVEKTQVRNSR